MNSVQLITQCNPIGLNVMRSTEQFNFSSSRGKSFDHTIDLIWFMRSGSDFGDNDVTVQSAIHVFGLTFDSDETVFFAVIEPVTSPSGADDALQLIRFDPQDLVTPSVAPQVQTLASQFHGSSRDPQEDESLVLEAGDVQVPHLVVRHGAIR